MSTYKIIADSLCVLNDQRTKTVNFEGVLELQAKFKANNVEKIHPASNSYFTASQGQVIPLNIEITSVSNATSVPISVELLELEPGGGQGDTDSGRMSGVINLPGDAVTQNLTVSISADKPTEKSGTVIVTFKAIKANNGTYKIIADTLSVLRDQRTGTINFEGDLELRAKFCANNVEKIYPSTSLNSYFKAVQGQVIPLNIEITSVPNLVSVPIKVELWELEPGGGQGDTDYGSMTGVISQSQGDVVTQNLTVSISADTWKEKPGTVAVTFKAIKQ